MKKSKKIIFIILLVCLFITPTTLIIAQAAYFIRGKCNGQRDFSPYNNKEQMELIEDLHLEQLEQM